MEILFLASVRNGGDYTNSVLLVSILLVLFSISMSHWYYLLEMDLMLDELSDATDSFDHDKLR